MARCTTSGCPRAATYPHSGKCGQCYSYFNRWHKRNSAAAMRTRRDQIALWDNRLSEMLKPRHVKKRGSRTTRMKQGG